MIQCEPFLLKLLPSGKDHRKMMTQLAKRGVTAGVTAGVTTGVTAGVTADVTADPSQQCEPTAPAPPDAEQSVSNLSQPQGQISGGELYFNFFLFRFIEKSRNHNYLSPFSHSLTILHFLQPRESLRIHLKFE